MADDKNWFQQALTNLREWQESSRAYLGLRLNATLRETITDTVLIIPTVARHIAHDVSARWAETAPDKPHSSPAPASNTCESHSVEPLPIPSTPARKNSKGTLGV